MILGVVYPSLFKKSTIVHVLSYALTTVAILYCNSGASEAIQQKYSVATSHICIAKN